MNYTLLYIMNLFTNRIHIARTHHKIFGVDYMTKRLDIYIYTCIYTQMLMYIYICTHTYVYIHMCVRTCVYMSIYVFERHFFIDMS